MATAFRGSTVPQMSRLGDDLVLLEHNDPGAVRARMSTNEYAVLADARALLYDTNSLSLLPLVDALRDEGFNPADLVLSHRHSAGLGDAVRVIAERFRVPVFLHPLDARHPQAAVAGVRFEDPMGHPLLTEFGVEALHFPGHTAGHVAHLPDDGGTLLTGDAAMGPSAPQTEAGEEYLIRPPFAMNVDDAELRERWLAFDRPVASVLPYHGTGYVNRAADLPTIMRPLLRPEPTMGLTG